VTHVTVVKTIARLRKEGLVRAQPYRSIFLTPAGKSLAAEAKHRHQIVLEFLRKLGVSEAAARVDAEGIEHHVSRGTLEAIERFCRSKR
jgi:DtxR family manganese transport transcriptional regulator